MSGNLNISRTDASLSLIVPEYNANFRLHTYSSGTTGQGSFAIYNTNKGSNSLILKESDDTIYLAQPLPLASGGTGQSSTTLVTLKDGVYIRRWGKMRYIKIYLTQTFAANSQTVICTLPTQDWPSDASYFVMQAVNGTTRLPIYSSITTEGVIQVMSGGSTALNGCYGQMVYMVK